MNTGRKIVVLISFLSVILIVVSMFGMFSMKIAHKSIEHTYVDCIFPLKHIKTISAMYEINIVDTAHKVRNETLSWAEGLENIDKALKTIDIEWLSYKATYLTIEEEALISELEPLFNNVNTSLNKLRNAIEKRDRDALIAYVARELYPNIDPLTIKLTKLEYMQIMNAKSDYDNVTNVYVINKSIATWGMIIGLSLVIIGTMKIVRNITKPLEKEIALYEELDRLNEEHKEKAKLLDLIFKHSLDSIVLLDKDFNFLRVSDTYARACQRDVSEFIGRNHFEMYPSNLKDEVEDVKAKRYVYSKSERPFMFPDHPEWGTTYWDLGLVPILDDKNEIAFFLFTLKDVTLQRRYKDELKALNENLQKRVDGEIEQNRLKDRIVFEQSRHIVIGELLVNISHHWRQPLCAVGLMVQDIRDAYLYNELDIAYMDNNVDAIMSELNMLSDTIENFRNFYVKDREQSNFNVKVVIDKALMLLSGHIKDKGIVIDKILDNSLMIKGFSNEFSQVILNILTNAKDVFEKRSVIDGVIKINSYKEEATGRTIITITDNGGGIQEDIMSKIFDPYFTTKHKARGTGNGLYMAKVLIEKNMNGTLSVRNINGGCEFRVEI
ncbi:PAS/PAC sensor signal transduction histidine kinase [Candidatus Magnetobacterium bavaricum]|uniref:histidine kinase n=1 Tax=Candidatus Magnetobacterium bavaricum TaxID=29290 RepID=A0A0F3GPV1_9BACT|nr:PAS/PAC sensor signal transduction histidine kinase [Candidatus Magnetobacterium bavaricum]